MAEGHVTCEALHGAGLDIHEDGEPNAIPTLIRLRDAHAAAPENPLSTSANVHAGTTVARRSQDHVLDLSKHPQEQCQHQYPWHTASLLHDP